MLGKEDDKMAKAIMIQGTMSNSGKSFLTAGLCRVFRQDGYRTAPFKSQNMALNSYITSEGLEIGRAQAMQAEAAGIEPTADMNPILLKPTSNVGSQVIVNGEVRGNMAAMDYYKRKKELIPDVMAAYQRLNEAYDIIVIEGAGSPAEINLHENDIVNMGMAKMAGAPVLLVGDIDRGGVFAALYGTVKLLEEEEQAMIKGLVVNKFRGDVKILEPGLEMIEERTGIPVVGVVPMEAGTSGRPGSDPAAGYEEYHGRYAVAERIGHGSADPASGGEEDAGDRDLRRLSASGQGAGRSGWGGARRYHERHGASGHQDRVLQRQDPYADHRRYGTGRRALAGLERPGSVRI